MPEPYFAEPYLATASWLDLEGAHQQARYRVENKLAASVNVLPKMDSKEMDSIYVFKGDLRGGREHKTFVKTSASRLPDLQRSIRSAHPCSVAEILQFKIDS